VTLEKLGSSYGGWYVPTNFLKNNDFEKFLISVGIGHDVTFDIELQKRGFKVVAIDPLEECCNFARSSDLDQTKTKIINAGLWLNSGQTRFYSPKIETHDSWSITNSQYTSKAASKFFPTVTLEDVFKEIGNEKSQQVIMLKMDVEGAERFLFKEIEANLNRLDFIGIELDYIHLLPFLKFIERIKLILEVRKTITILRKLGLLLIFNDDFNFFWINEIYLSKIKVQI
jgi:FkbM family methyltransferase